MQTDLNRLHRDLATAVILFHEGIARRLGMTPAERKCAGILAELGSATPGQLMAATALTSGAITGIVDRLVRAGYAEREPNPNDRRSIIVRARNSQRLVEETGTAFASLSAEMEGMLGRYSESERALIFRHLTDTIAVLRQETTRLEPAGAAGRRRS
jgi:DNA-binding MarR family transcriptional regulator